MDTREVFLDILNFRSTKRTLRWEFGYWIGAIERWYKEGLAKRKGFSDKFYWGDALAGPGLRSFSDLIFIDEDIDAFFNFDKGTSVLPVNPWIFPEFEKKVIEETDETIILVDTDGIKKKTYRDLRSMPLWLDYPVKNEKDWEKFKHERLNINSFGERIPADLSIKVNEIKKNNYPVTILGYPCGFLGSLRYIIGQENLFIMYYDNPDLIKKINSYLCDFWISYCEELMGYSEFDCGYIWEDMAGKNGMLVSPAIFNEFMKPYYLRITGFLRSRGIKKIIIDSDGYVEDMIPLLESVGINGLLPVEKQAGNNLLRIRKNHPHFILMGGFNKAILRDGNKTMPADIDEEISVIKEMIKLGGFIPHADHSIPPDVSWQNFKSYRKKLDAVIYDTEVKGR
jgi:uroporphyrinogen-III decarboxylase